MGFQLGCMLAALAAIGALPTSLLAHTRLVRSEPAAGARLVSSPAAIRLVFSEWPVAELTTVRLTFTDGTLVTLDSAYLDPLDKHIVVFAVPRLLDDGNYHLAWSTAARDGHAIRGSFDFAVAGAATEPSIAPAPVVAPPPVSDSEPTVALSGAVGVTAARLLAFLSLFVVIGVVAFRFTILRRAGVSEDSDPFLHIASTNAATLGILGAIGVLVSALVKLSRESADMPDVAVSTILLSTTWGWSWLLQVIASLVAASAFRGIHKGTGRARTNCWKIALVSALALSITPALSGHAISGDAALLAIPVDMVHVLAGSMWLGTLAAIVTVGIPSALKTPDAGRPGARVAQLINLFSPVALTCGAVVVGTGAISSLLHIRPLAALWTTTYGVALIVKVIFVALLFAAGAWNWRRMRPRLTGDDAVVPMRSMASLELVLAVAVLGITAVLVALELP